MTTQDFIQCVTDNTAPPAALPPIQQSLWWAIKGDWDQAHTIVQGIPDETGSWVHANLHREEGDLANAQYWYARASRHMPNSEIEEERKTILAAVLSDA